MKHTIGIFLFFFLLAGVDSILIAQEVKPIDVRTKIDTINETITPDTSMQVLKVTMSIPVNSPDTLFLFNGDVYACKIQSFEQGRFKIDAQGPGIIYIKWYKVKYISGGTMKFKVEDNHGNIFIGRILKSTQAGELIVGDSNRTAVASEDLARIFPLEAKWYKKFKGSLGGGFNYNKSSEVLQVNADYNIYYVISKWRFTNNFSYIETKDKGEDQSIRFDWSLQALYSLHKKWVLYELNTLSRNDELGIKARISFGVGGGNSVVFTEIQRLSFLTGIVQNSEMDIESNQTVSNFEWPFYVQHTIYSFIRPDLTSNTAISSYVGITEKGRYRLDFSTDVTWKIITNFSLKLAFYYNFDNKDVEGKDSKIDYGTSLSILLELK